MSINVVSSVVASPNRAQLKSVNSKIKTLFGPTEKSKAKKWVAGYTASNAGIAAIMAQAPGADEFVLSSVEVVMATHIFNKIYGFGLDKTALKSLAAGVSGAYVGSRIFKGASKFFTWVPGIGNGLNAAVAGTTTAAIGASLIAIAEDMDDARRRGKKIDDFIKEMEN